MIFLLPFLWILSHTSCGLIVLPICKHLGNCYIYIQPISTINSNLIIILWYFLWYFPTKLLMQLFFAAKKPIYDVKFEFILVLAYMLNLFVLTKMHDFIFINIYSFFKLFLCLFYVVLPILLHFVSSHSPYPKCLVC